MLPGRNTAGEITNLLVEANVDEEADLTEYIDVANELVTEVCATVLLADLVTPKYTSHRLKKIEAWLTAHFYCILDPQSQRDRVAVITFESQSKVDLCLDQTRYGQQAKLLDTAGGLARLDEIAKGNIKILTPIGRLIWLGTPNSELPTAEGL